MSFFAKLPDGFRSQSRIAAIGDIHGEADLFRAALDLIEHPGETRLILLGDLIDRGPESGQCLEIARELESGDRFKEVVILPGNHEQMMFWSLNPGYHESWQDVWLSNGGMLVLDEFDFDFEAARNALPKQIIHRLQGRLPIWRQDGDLLFVHAGLRPGVDPLEFLQASINGGQAGPHSFSETESALWIRREFLDPRAPGDHRMTLSGPGIVVHGHTRLEAKHEGEAKDEIKAALGEYRLPLDMSGSGILPVMEVEGDEVRISFASRLEPSIGGPDGP